jgi:hypothetical protein
VRATFGIVLGTAVLAAVGLSMVLHREPGEAGDAGASESRTTMDEASAPAPKVSSDPTPAPAPPALAARVDDLLVKNDAASAARALLAAEPRELGAAAVRERAFRTADALVAAGDQAKDAAATGLRLDARRLYAALYAVDEATAEESTRAFDACVKLHQSLLFGNGAPESLVLRHKVAAGESIWALARGPWKQRGVSVPPGFVLHVNGIADARRLRVGQSLRVPLEPMRVLVRKSRFELAVLLGGAPVERFPVAIGADASTPSGACRVRDRIKNPDWYFHGKRIPFGDPQNIIGTRWIGLSGSAAIEGIGIHGTFDDASVGKAASMGCVRMHNTDVERLFEWVDAGTEVEIRD